jgi:hypothetical protein
MAGQKNSDAPDGDPVMNIHKSALFLIVLAIFLILVIPAAAQPVDQNVNEVYQAPFTTDPRWTTDNPSNDYWDPALQMYHFGIQPSTGAYAYKAVELPAGSFTLEYDVILTQVDQGATFRFGLTGDDMDLGKGPNVLTEFTNAKYGRIMWLHVVTPYQKLMEQNSESSAVEMGPNAYSGPTATYDLNKTYHVTLKYDDDSKTVTMWVDEKLTGTTIWSYYINSVENLKGFTRIYLGSVGDYGNMYSTAAGNIDNVRLTIPAAGITPVETSTITYTPTPLIVTTPEKTIAIPTPYPTETPKSPSSGILAIGALAVTGACYIASRKVR